MCLTLGVVSVITGVTKSNAFDFAGILVPIVHQALMKYNQKIAFSPF
jgi:hypothetical protein